MSRAVPALIFAASMALAGCRTTEIGDPIEIALPHNLSSQSAQTLVTRFIEASSGARMSREDPLRHVFASARGRHSMARRLRGKWRIEAWNPESMVAAYAWKRHILRVEIEFQDRSLRLGLGEGTNVDQSATQIHSTAKALALELAQEIRFVFGKVASGSAPVAADAAAISFCDAMWGSNSSQRESCGRAQKRSYDRLRPLIDLVKVKPSAPDSQRMKACYARAQTRAGTDWESTERCFYSYPASDL